MASRQGQRRLSFGVTLNIFSFSLDESVYKTLEESSTQDDFLLPDVF